MKPMLATEVDINDLAGLIADDNVVAQQKLDGTRKLIERTAEGKLKVFNRSGDPASDALPRQVVEQFAMFAGLRLAMAFDCELVGDTLHVFDMPFAEGTTVVTSSPYRERHAKLEEFFSIWRPGPCVQLLETFYGPTDKRWLVDEVFRLGGEGLVLKRLTAPYRQGPRRSTGTLKAKYVKTLEAEVFALGSDGKNNAHVQVYDHDGNPVDIGTVSLNGKPPVRIGDVIEIKYLYVLAGSTRLVQPRMLRVRTDKPARACSIDQLVFTDRRILTRQAA